MIVLERNFLFIHPQKCAGGSLKSIFRKLINRYPRDVREKWDPKRGNHWTAEQWQAHARDNDIDFTKLFKITTIRNPWDRAVSYYHHRQTHNKLTCSFDDFVLKAPYLTDKTYSLYYKVTLNDNYIIDHVIRYETYVDDVKKLMNILNITQYHLPQLKYNTTRVEYNYKKYYTNSKTIDRIYDISKYEIDKFKYEY